MSVQLNFLQQPFAEETSGDLEGKQTTNKKHLLDSELCAIIITMARVSAASFLVLTGSENMQLD